MRNRQNRLQTASIGTEMLMTSVFFFPPIASPLSPSSTICLCLLSFIGLFLLCEFSHGCLKEKKILATFHIDSPRLQDLESFSLPNSAPPLPFITSLCLPCLPLFVLTVLLFHQNFCKMGALWSPPMCWGQRCSRLKRTL